MTNKQHTVTHTNLSARSIMQMEPSLRSNIVGVFQLRALKIWHCAGVVTTRWPQPSATLMTQSGKSSFSQDSLLTSLTDILLRPVTVASQLRHSRRLHSKKDNQQLTGQLLTTSLLKNNKLPLNNMSEYHVSIATSTSYLRLITGPCQVIYTTCVWFIQGIRPLCVK